MPILTNVTEVLVEPDDVVRAVSAAGLRKCGAIVYEAASAQMGLMLVQRERPQVLVAALALPDAGGVDLMQAVRRLPASADTLALALTDGSRPADRSAAILGGFQ